MFLRTDLDQLLSMEGNPAVSLYLPTHVAGREMRQDRVRLRNLLQEAFERLSGRRRRPDIEALLAPAHRLIDDDSFWAHPEEALAVFLVPGGSLVYKLQQPVAEQVIVGKHLHITPLMPLLDEAGWFWLLTITGVRTCLYRGTRWIMVEQPVDGLPQGYGAIRGETNYDEPHMAGTTGAPRAQSFGDAPDAVRKQQLMELLHRIAAAVEPHIRRHPAPVIIAAQREIQGHFREIAGWKEIVPEGIVENPDALRADELRRKAHALIQPHAAAAQAEAIGHLHALLGTRNGKATTKPETIVKAAVHGQVDRLFLTSGSQLWGSFDEADDRVVAHGHAVGEDDDDLLDYAALMTLRQGGHVSLVDRNMLGRDLAAAVLRWEQR
jgi:hypothetical protein